MQRLARAFVYWSRELLVGPMLTTGRGLDRLERLIRRTVEKQVRDPELLFEVPMGERWQETYERLGVSPSGFINVPGGAQA